MRAQRRTVASFRENFKLPARLWEQREVLRCVDLHCGGEPATVVFGGGGVADAPGATMFAKRAHVMERMDRWREVLLHEPRGYPCSNVDYLVEPTLAGADAGFVIAEQAKIYPLMSGHNTICVATALVQGRKRVIQVRFNMRVPRAIVPEKGSTLRERRTLFLPRRSSSAARCPRTGGRRSCSRRPAGPSPSPPTSRPTADASASPSAARRPSSANGTRSYNSTPPRARRSRSRRPRCASTSPTAACGTSSSTPRTSA
jgi:hypothetical protein